MNVPRVFNCKARAARDVLSEAFSHYLKENGHEQGSALMHMRVQNAEEQGIPMDDIAR